MMSAPMKEEFRWKICKKGKHIFNVCRHVFVYAGATAALMTSASGLALANPADGTVVGGSATITDTASELQIHQHTNRALIEWSSFNIGKGETTRFYQPGKDSIALNRVVNSNQISSINGNLIANGRVVIINPNGVLIGANGNVDTAGFIATSADVDDEAFDNGLGAIEFKHAGNADAFVENQGSITVGEAGLAALVAPTVRNSGIVQGNLAKVQLAAADTFAVDFYGDGLIQFAVDAPADDQPRKIAVENSGSIIADGGAVLMTAADASNVVESVINSDGYIQARSLENRGGKIVLTGAGATVNVSGKMDVSGQGDANGGEILIGGDYQGQGDIATAENTTVSETAVLNADGGQNGDGGKIIVWADNTAITRGDFYARGGSESGDGGLIETSGKNTIDFVGTYADASALSGKGGLWLIDPTTLYIDQALADTISASPTDVTMVTSDGATIDGNINITTLDVDLSITAGASGINASNNFIRTNSGDVTLFTTGAIDLNKTTVFTTGGNVSLTGSTVSMNNNAAIGTAGGSVYMYATAVPTGNADTVSLNNSSIDTSGGTTAGGINLLDETGAFHNPPGAGATDAQKAAWAGNNQTFYDSSQNGGTVTLRGKGIKTNSVCINAGGSLSCGVVADPIATNVTVTIDSFTKVYGTADPMFTWAITSGALSGGDTLSVDLARYLQGLITGEQVGNYSIFQNAYSVIGSGLYNITFVNGNLQIVPAALVIKAVDQTKTYGDDLVLDGTSPSTDFTVTGLISSIDGNATGDAVNSVSLTSGGLAAGANAGSYIITSGSATGTNLNNYNITYQTGDLLVNKAVLNVAVDNKSMTYGGAFPSLTASYSGFKNTDNISNIDMLATLSSGTSASANAGFYNDTLTASGAFDNNYTFAYSAGDLTINKALLTVTADDKTITYGGAAPILTNTITGFVNGENASVIDMAGSVASGTLFTADAGTYLNTLNASGYSDNNYNFTYVAGDLTIGKAALTVTANGLNKVYDGLTYSGGNGITYLGFVNGDTELSNDLTGALAYSGTSQGAKDVGGYLITPGGFNSNNYIISYANGALNITPAALTIAAVNQSKTYGTVYNFDEITPSGDFTITGLQNGETIGSVSLSSAGAVSTANAGSYAIDVSGATGGTANLSNYNVSYAPGTLLVTAAGLTLVVDNASKIYGDANPTFTGTLLGVVGSDDVSATYNTTADIFSNVGTYAIVGGLTGSDLGNYAITSITDGILTVNKRTLDVTTADKIMTYGGVAPTLTNSITGFVNGDGLIDLDITGTIASGTLFTADAGTYTDTLNSSGYIDNNYNFNYIAGDLTINKADLTVTANGLNKIYDGLAYSGGNGVNIVGLVNGDTVLDLGGALNYSGTSQGATNVGGYVITPGGYTSGNYNISFVNGALNITPAALNITALNQSKTYGDNFTFNGTEFSSLGLQNGETLGTATITSAGAGPLAGVAAGPYTINISNATGGTANLGNYSVTYNTGLFTVNKALLTVDVLDRTMTYGGSFPGVIAAVSGFKNGENPSVIDTIGFGASGTPFNSDAGVYTDTLTASGFADDNYSFTYLPGTLTINPAALTITAIGLDKVYDATPYSGGNGVTYAGFVNGDTEFSNDFNGALAYSGTSQGAQNVGNYVITPGGFSSNNYVITYVNGALNITPAALTITANDLTKTYDATAFSGGNGVSYAGFVGGEDEFTSDLAGSIVYGGSSQGAVNVVGSPYVITASGQTSSNYAITYVDGVLNITPKALVVTIDNQTKVYGDADPTLTYSISGLVGGDTGESVLPSGLDRVAGENVGGYLIYNVDATSQNSNYFLSGVNFNTLDITPASLLITANNDTKIYDGVPYSGGNGYTIKGFKLNDDSSVIFGLNNIFYVGSSQGAVNPGSYVIDPLGKVGAQNYTITFAPGALSINPAPVSYFEIDPLGRPIISVANQAIVLDEPFEAIETLTIDTDVGISSASISPQALAGISPAAGEEGTEAEQVASIEPAAGGDDQGSEGEQDEFAQDIVCANSFLDNKPCDVEQSVQ